jgi:hypothetical protein
VGNCFALRADRFQALQKWQAALSSREFVPLGNVSALKLSQRRNSMQARPRTARALHLQHSSLPCPSPRTAALCFISMFTRTSILGHLQYFLASSCAGWTPIEFQFRNACITSDASQLRDAESALYRMQARSTQRARVNLQHHLLSCPALHFTRQRDI